MVYLGNAALVHVTRRDVAGCDQIAQPLSCVWLYLVVVRWHRNHHSRMANTVTDASGTRHRVPERLVRSPRPSGRTPRRSAPRSRATSNVARSRPASASVRPRSTDAPAGTVAFRSAQSAHVCPSSRRYTTCRTPCQSQKLWCGGQDSTPAPRLASRGPMLATR